MNKVWLLRRRLSAGLGALALLVWQAPAWAVDVYTIDLNSSKSSYNVSHIMRLLAAALDASKAKYGPYELHTAQLRMERDRLLLEMIKGESVNLSAQATTMQWEQALMPIRIPVDKGISGYRISLINGADQAQFNAVHTLEQLKAKTMGAGSQWSSTAVFLRAGFDIVQSNSSANLHSMLAAGRFQHFPRAIDEAVFEQAYYAPAFPALRVENTIAVYAPMPRYFFIGGRQRRLAERLEYGMQLLIADGRFDQIFHQFYDGLIEQVGLRKRRIYRIDNPYLSPQTPLSNKAYWYDPLAHK